MRRTKFFISVLFVLIAPEIAYPEYGAIPESSIDPAVIKIDEDKYLGAKISGDYIFLDEKGEEFKMGDIMGKPIIILLSYYSCNGLCPTANKKLKDVITGLNRFKAGEDYRIITLSFDKEDDILRMRMFTDMAGLRGLTGDSWRIVVMKNKDEIENLTGSVGFKFFWSSRDKMFLHPNVFIFISPEGRVVRYLYGTSLNVREVELAITEAIWEQSASSNSKVADLISMACYSYNFKEGKYTVNYPIVIGFGSLLLGISFISIPLLVLRKRKRKEGGI